MLALHELLTRDASVVNLTNFIRFVSRRSVNVIIIVVFLLWKSIEVHFLFSMVRTPSQLSLLLCFVLQLSKALFCQLFAIVLKLSLSLFHPLPGTFICLILIIIAFNSLRKFNTRFSRASIGIQLNPHIST